MAKKRKATVNIEVTRGKHGSQSVYLLTYRGKTYRCDKYVWEACGSPWRDEEQHMDMIQSKEDFGGCGKQALKPVDVPLMSFLTGHCTEIESLDQLQVQETVDA